MASCGEVLVGLLDDYGIDTIFGIPGVHTIELYRGLKASNIQHITPRHEQGAGFMADGHYRASGKLAACFIITGPGMTNIATAMGQALADSIPMLVISSVNHSHQLGMGEGRLHEMPNQNNLIAGVSRFSHTLLRADELAKVLARAFAVFNCERPGPVHIEIPIDVLSSNVHRLDNDVVSLPYPPGPSPVAIIESIALIKKAERPLIIIGGGSVRASKEVITFAEKLEAPVLNTVNAKGVLPYSHMLAVGGSVSCPDLRDVLDDADLVIAIGTEFGETDYNFFFHGDVSLSAKLIRIDIDAEQLTRNLPADISICSDASYALQAINFALGDYSFKNGSGLDRALALKKKLQDSRDPDYEKFFATIREALPEVITVGDSTQPVYYAWLHYETEHPRRYFHSASGFGTLGYAIPAAIGAKQAVPNNPVVGLIGDGALQFTVGELASAVELGLPVIFLVWNNYGYGEIKRFMNDADVEPVGVDIRCPNLVDLGKAFGCDATRVVNLEDLKSELIRANEKQTPTLIEVLQQDFISSKPSTTTNLN